MATTPQSSLPDTETLEARYQRAATLQQGMLNRHFIPNDILFPHWIEQSDCFWYERILKRGKHYRLVDAKAMTNDAAFNHETLARALATVAGQDVEADNLPITNVEITLSPAQVSFDAFDKRWVFESDAAVCREIDVVPESWLLSPDGKQAVFTRDFNLWVRDLASGEQCALTDDGAEDFIYAIEGEAYGGSSDPWGKKAQACWSPDGKQVFTLVRDTREVKDFPVVHHVPLDGSIRPKVVNYKIALPGDDRVPEYQLLAIDIKTGKHQQADYPGIPVLNNGRGYFNVGMGWWATDSQRAYFVDQARDYQRIQVVEFDTATGKTRVLLTETSETHLNLASSTYDHPAFLPLPETNELVWWSERTGWGHLYLYNLDTGELKHAITEGEWLVRQVLQVDLNRRELFIETAGRETNRDAYYRDLCTVSIDTDEITAIASTDHDYFVASKSSLTLFYAKAIGLDVESANAISPNSEFAVVTRTRVDQAPASLLFDRRGNELLKLETADISVLPTGWQWPEPVKLKAADGKTAIYGVVFRPSDFDPNQSYPVVASGHYMPDIPVTPKGSFCCDPRFGMSYIYAASLAELGFIVVMIDGRGTPYRDKPFLDESYGWVLSASNMEDEIAGIRQLAARYAYMDLERVGVICPSGGPGAVLGLLEHPDFYKVGVSGVQHDSRLMPCTMMGDKFEGLSGPDASRQYPEQLAENLKGKLLLMHGMLDQGNPPACLFRVAKSLELANKDFDMHLFAQGHHGASNYQLRRSWDYLVKHLLGLEPPKEFDLVSAVDMSDLVLKLDAKAK